MGWKEGAIGRDTAAAAGRRHTAIDVSEKRFEE